ncbi:putative 8kDa protein [Vanilla latent virus]|uniref:Movement protein TGBp3 n=1 Tax=Vanilla latent virus TaxID=2016426 RepID=A0A220NQ61_9VIRU|nr:putative 8kDa protein [Vanilla latent virus]ASJ78780.1 putative 8kDa protein [Vanilla latent virus]
MSYSLSSYFQPQYILVAIVALGLSYTALTVTGNFLKPANCIIEITGHSVVVSNCPTDQIPHLAKLVESFAWSSHGLH